MTFWLPSGQFVVRALRDIPRAPVASGRWDAFGHPITTNGPDISWPFPRYSSHTPATAHGRKPETSAPLLCLFASVGVNGGARACQSRHRLRRTREWTEGDCGGPANRRRQTRRSLRCRPRMRAPPRQIVVGHQPPGEYSERW